jgi:serine protease SohB
MLVKFSLYRYEEGIEFQTITAGKYKRTITPTKKIEAKDVEKSKADIEDVLTLFKTFVGQQRPQLDIDNVATGETWLGLCTS